VSARIKTVTLGCKVNQYETEFVREGLKRVGYVDAGEGETAELCVVNTCTVTNEGDAKSRQTIRRLHRENPQARIVVMGCYATRAPQEVAQLPGVAEVVTDKRELPDLLGRFGVVDIPTGISGLSGRNRAYVKVQDGCLLNCSYCIIPKVRPVMYSRPETEILSEITRMVERGFREIVLTGIHLGHYGVDFNRGLPREQWTRLATLLEKIMAIGGDFRVRLSSIEATEVTRGLLDVMAANPQRICAHLHVCLQSGSDWILRAMRRRWNAKRIVDRCELVKQRLLRPAFSTDVIVGFPGETEADFEQTVQVCREIGFSKIHVFPFSPRRGTDAATMTEQVAADIKAARCERLQILDRELRGVYAQQLLGSQLQILIEHSPPGSQPQGTTCRYLTGQVQFNPLGWPGGETAGLATGRRTANPNSTESIAVAISRNTGATLGLVPGQFATIEATEIQGEIVCGPVVS
jgi:threonylcarbamoyladenosine tRNA methylthiotransferase MtaB